MEDDNMVVIELFANMTVEQQQYAQLHEADVAEFYGPGADDLEYDDGGLGLGDCKLPPSKTISATSMSCPGLLLV